MAAEPVKSQPLHNFPLTHLKWVHHSSTSNHRFRRRDSPTSDGGSEQPPPPPRAEAKNAAEDGEAKAWNLRPRKSETNCAAEKSDLQKSQRLRGFAEVGAEKKEKKKRKLWISLSREEIEEDVYSLTGSRPNRRPKKRPKSVQKFVDNVFPGLYLVGVSVDSYRAHESLK